MSGLVEDEAVLLADAIEALTLFKQLYAKEDSGMDEDSHAADDSGTDEDSDAADDSGTDEDSDAADDSDMDEDSDVADDSDMDEDSDAAVANSSRFPVLKEKYSVADLCTYAVSENESPDSSYSCSEPEDDTLNLESSPPSKRIRCSAVPEFLTQKQNNDVSIKQTLLKIAEEELMEIQKRQITLEETRLLCQEIRLEYQQKMLELTRQWSKEQPKDRKILTRILKIALEK